ncbi:diguanylate cyclase [Vibrio astriarenae]|uniref:diguanylate cyclase n=1 Tax=Vibrio astriarenae TaxID=1481923 RepID=A0A7Z2T3L4_9VIBR|nr:GGDEF domain-containing protein [Vibrio astriarenae]QIA63656.1 diguanylate cyclase [Vibrio astriarenae]
MSWEKVCQLPSIKHVEVKTLAFLLLFIFLVNTPISYIKKNAIVDIEEKVEKSAQLFASNLAIVQSYISLSRTPLAMNFERDPDAFNATVSKILSGQTYLKLASIVPSEMNNDELNSQSLPIIDLTNDGLYLLRTPVIDQGKEIGQLLLAIEARAYFSYLYNGMFIMAEDGFIHWTRHDDVPQGAHLPENYQEVLRQIHRLGRLKGSIDLGPHTAVFKTVEDIHNDRAYLVHLVNNSEIVPTHIYITFALAIMLVVVTNVFMDTKKRKRELEQISFVDQLSTLNNRHYLDHIEPSILSNDAYHIGIIDIDHFKRVNDSFGHAIGDKVIRSVAQAIKSSIRADDYAFRLGGEEFAVVIKTSDTKVACEAMERIRLKVAECSISPRVTVSIGIAPITKTVKDALSVADQFLYVAKNSGRNQVRSVPYCC